MVRAHPDPPVRWPGAATIEGASAIEVGGSAVGIGGRDGGVAQLGEHLLCKQGVIGSIPFTSTRVRDRQGGGGGWRDQSAARR